MEPIKIVIQQGNKVLSEFTCVDEITKAFLRGDDICARVGGYDPDINACCRGIVQVSE